MRSISISMPIWLRPNVFAAIRDEPEPANGSMTSWPGCENVSISGVRMVAVSRWDGIRSSESLSTGRHQRWPSTAAKGFPSRANRRICAGRRGNACRSKVWREAPKRLERPQYGEVLSQRGKHGGGWHRFAPKLPATIRAVLQSVVPFLVLLPFLHKAVSPNGFRGKSRTY
jgi:hypothetical protein